MAHVYEELFACEARHHRTSLVADARGAIVRSLADRDRRASVHG